MKFERPLGSMDSGELGFTEAQTRCCIYVQKLGESSRPRLRALLSAEDG